MTDPERSFTPQDPEFAVIGMANMFFGREFPNSRQGLNEALSALRVQHEKVMPPTSSRTQLLQIVVQKDPVIETTEQMAAIALEDDDYESALLTANHLYAYGEADFNDSLGGEAFRLSLSTHRLLAQRIRDKFSTQDPYLRVAGQMMFSEIEQLRSQGNKQRELELLRGIIHTVALNGTIGESAKQRFDPSALVHIE